MYITKLGKVFLSKSSGSEEEEVGEERCVATTNDASGQPMTGGERHRMASCVQILMHYSLFVYSGTGLEVMNCVCKSCDYNAMCNECVCKVWPPDGQRASAASSDACGFNF